MRLRRPPQAAWAAAVCRLRGSAQAHCTAVSPAGRQTCPAKTAIGIAGTSVQVPSSAADSASVEAAIGALARQVLRPLSPMSAGSTFAQAAIGRQTLAAMPGAVAGVSGVPAPLAVGPNGPTAAPWRAALGGAAASIAVTGLPAAKAALLVAAAPPTVTVPSMAASAPAEATCRSQQKGGDAEDELLRCSKAAAMAEDVVRGLGGGEGGLIEMARLRVELAASENQVEEERRRWQAEREALHAELREALSVSEFGREALREQAAATSEVVRSAVTAVGALPKFGDAAAAAAAAAAAGAAVAAAEQQVGGSDAGDVAAGRTGATFAVATAPGPGDPDLAQIKQLMCAALASVHRIEGRQAARAAACAPEASPTPEPALAAQQVMRSTYATQAAVQARVEALQAELIAGGLRGAPGVWQEGAALEASSLCACAGVVVGVGIHPFPPAPHGV
eukprot:NODE_6943_length_1623_cov_5.376337.p1 GENE.NODE_6943_length_1623_cov_5.376337~~NODE_6943_length_1623_cov_5.376337.p1  ORF type:complete len:449 (+),score=132.42 NODE_6943_length_1623_cov_5.376337:1-1347(+)